MVATTRSIRLLDESGQTVTGALLGAACTTSATGRQQLLLLSDSDLNTMGKQAFQDVKKEEPVAKEARTNDYVSCVAHTLLAANGAKPAEWEVVVFESKEANAFALPGRKIGVYTGMLGVAKTPDQHAAVIGHEIAHVTQQHSKERVSQQMVAEGGMQVDQFGLKAALQLPALHIHVARFDVGDVDQPASLRPTVKDDENDRDHRADQGQR